MRLRKYFATSDSRLARLAREARRRAHRVTLPTPGFVAIPMLWVFLAVRSFYYLTVRLLVCEPLFKAYCWRHGRGVRTGVYVHWVSGKGRIILGDEVTVDGKCSFSFAARYSDEPTLLIGDRSSIGHGCSFTVGKRITIGEDCRIAADVWIFDSSGHPTEPTSRLQGRPAPDDEVRPVVIGDNVWIGGRSIIFPGVTIGNGSVISAGSVVLSEVPSGVIVAGNPARRVAALRMNREENGGSPGDSRQQQQQHLASFSGG